MITLAIAGNNINFRSLCICYNNRQQTNPNALLNLKQALLHSNNGIQILMTYIYNNNSANFQQLFDYVNGNSTNTYQGNGNMQDEIEFIKLYLLDNNSQALPEFYTILDEMYNFDCDLLEQILNDAFQLDPELVYAALANLDGIRDVFYNQSQYFDCDLNNNTTDIIALLSNNSETVWNALLQSQNAAYWLTWLKNNDPDFIYHAAFKYPNLVSTYQTNNNLYGGAYNGKQNYFVNLRNGLGQSTYDMIVSFFTGQSSLYIDSMNLSEWHIYGSSRLGIYQTNVNLAYRNIHIVNGVATDSTSATLTNPSYSLYALERGAKRYELTGHTQNVHVVISDKKIQVCSTSVVTSYTSDVVSANDYSPFHSTLQGRSFTAPNTNYRFGGAGGQEKDDEIFKGAYTAEYWEYNSNLAKRLNLDPKSNPSISDYACFNNNPIWFTDIKGDSGEYYDTKGTLLFSSHDKLPNAAIIIPDEKLERFSNTLRIMKNNTIKNPEALQTNKANVVLRSLGITYDLNSYWGFYDKHSKDFHNGSDYKPLDDKSKLVNETKVVLHNVNGILKMGGANETFYGNPGGVSGGGGDAVLHTHPSERRRVMSLNTKQTGTFQYRGHEDDISFTQQKEGTGLYDIGVTNTEIRLYNSNNIKFIFIRGQNFK